MRHSVTSDQLKKGGQLMRDSSSHGTRNHVTWSIDTMIRSQGDGAEDD
jgi:hypothetical protein